MLASAAPPIQGNNQLEDSLGRSGLVQFLQFAAKEHKDDKNDDDKATLLKRRQPWW
jgi:hypothetical protein